MISISSKVHVNGGHYDGIEGVVVGIRRSTRDGVSFVIESPEQDKPVQVKSKFVVETKPAKAKPTPNYEAYVGKAAYVTTFDGILEDSSQGLPDGLALMGNRSKQTLVTLVFEQDGVTYANLVFQGQYAVVPAKNLRICDRKFDGLS